VSVDLLRDGRDVLTPAGGRALIPPERPATSEAQLAVCARFIE
jgi:hypothetical protein